MAKQWYWHGYAVACVPATASLRCFSRLLIVLRLPSTHPEDVDYKIYRFRLSQTWKAQVQTPCPLSQVLQDDLGHSATSRFHHPTTRVAREKNNFRTLPPS